MRTYKMTISYDGTRYQGWQRQAMTDNTIQHILEWTIGRMVGYRVQVDGSGRTDAPQSESGCQRAVSGSKARHRGRGAQQVTRAGIPAPHVGENVRSCYAGG